MMLFRSVIVLALLLVGSAQAQMNSFFPGPGTVHSAGGGGYTGPLDVISTNVIACYSLEACSAALRGTPAVNVCNSTGGVDVGCGNLSTDATTGLLVPATISGITCPGANCTIKTWYDQTAGNQCGGATCDLVTGAGTVATRPTIIASGFGSGPAAVMSTTQSLDSFTSNLTLAQPYTMSSVSCRSAAAGGTEIFFGNSASNGSMLWDNTPQLELFAGTIVAVAAATNNTWQFYAGAFNDAGGTKSSGMVSGGSLVNNLTTGGGGFGGTPITINSASFPSNHRTVENIIWSADKSASFSALQANQSSRFGSGSC
jgi:hypothetical protein